MKQVFRSKILPLMAICAVGLLLSATAVRAQERQTPPGCSPEILEAMEARANAEMVKRHAERGAIYKQPDNSLGMTCYDQAVAMTVKIGQVFSDVPPLAIDINPPNRAIFGNSSYPMSEVYTKPSSYLLNILNDTVLQQAKRHAGNFDRSVSALLGATNLGFLDGYARQLQQIINGYIRGPSNTIGNAVDTMNDVMRNLKRVLNLLGAALPGAVGGIVSTINTIWDTVEDISSGTIRQALGQIKDFLQPIIGEILGNSFGLHPDEAPCDRIAELWGRKDSSGNQMPGSFGVPILGGGSANAGVPYADLQDLLSGNLPGAAGDYLQVLQSGNNSRILQKAADIFGAGGNLSGPGLIPSWPRVPDIPSNANSRCVLRLLRGQSC